MAVVVVMVVAMVVAVAVMVTMAAARLLAVLGFVRLRSHIELRCD